MSERFPSYYLVNGISLSLSLRDLIISIVITNLPSLWIFCRYSGFRGTQVETHCPKQLLKSTKTGLLAIVLSPDEVVILHLKYNVPLLFWSKMNFEYYS